MPELDLATPGTFIASAQDAAKYRIYLLVGSSRLTPQAIAESPDREDAGIVFRTGWLPDAGGRVEYALTEADTVAIERRLAAVTDPDVRAVVVATPGGGDGKPAGADGGTFQVKHGHIIFERLVDEESGEPLGGVDYEIVNEKGAVVEKGTTPASGVIEHDVPAAGRYRIRLVEPAAQAGA